VVAAILVPALFVVCCADGPLFAVADGLELLAGNAELLEGFLNGLCAFGAEGEVVFGGATLVTVAFDQHVQLGMLADELRVGLLVTPPMRRADRIQPHFRATSA
jgi:hypothetical protein